MYRTFNFLMGFTLVAAGILGLVGAMLGWTAFMIAGYLWPLLVVVIGLLFVGGGILGREPGLGGLFIPGMPVLATGLLLLVANALQRWDLWGVFWPVELLALALGFSAASLKMRIVWLNIPAIWLGLNGAALQFTALTGRWEMWSWLWAIEILGVALTLLLTAAATHNRIVAIVGGWFAATALFVAGVMVLLVHGSEEILGLAGPLLLLGLGAWLVVRGLFARKTVL